MAGHTVTSQTEYVKELEKVGLSGCIDQKVKELSFGMRQNKDMILF